MKMSKCPICAGEGLIPCDDPENCDGSCAVTGGMVCVECFGEGFTLLDMEGQP